jgi:stress response protein YsnF
MSDIATASRPFETALEIQRSALEMQRTVAGLFMRSAFSPFEVMARLAGERDQPRSTSRSLVRVQGDASERVIPVGEEYLQVRKELVPGETTRVTRSVVETPVEEQVELITETVVVERRRPVVSATGDVLSERVTDMTATWERPVVTKGRRVVEEVVLRGQKTSHVETIRETVLRDSIDVRQPNRMPVVAPHKNKERHDAHKGASAG